MVILVLPVLRTSLPPKLKPKKKYYYLLPFVDGLQLVTAVNVLLLSPPQMSYWVLAVTNMRICLTPVLRTSLQKKLKAQILYLQLMVTGPKMRVYSVLWNFLPTVTLMKLVFPPLNAVWMVTLVLPVLRTSLPPKLKKKYYYLLPFVDGLQLVT